MKVNRCIVWVATAFFILCTFIKVPIINAENTTYSVEVSSESFGNIFYESNPRFVQRFKASEDKTVIVINKIIDDTKTVIRDDLSRISLVGNVEREIYYEINGLGYGIYKLKTELYSMDNALIDYVETDFSKVKPAEKINDEVGIHVLFQNDGSAYMVRTAQIVDLYKKTGFSSFRDSGWTWSEIEKTQGVYSLKTFFRNEKALISDGGNHSMLLTLNHGNDIYTGGYDVFARTEDELKAWKNYCKELAVLTKDADVSFEVFNEFDMKSTPEEYYPLLKYAYEGVKEGNPNAKLIGMVTSYCNLNFIKKVIDLGGANYLDAISVHPYTWSYTPEQFDLMNNIKSVRSYMDNNGMKNKELIITELGYYGFVGREQQASNYVRTLALNKACGAADKFYFFRYAAPNRNVEHEDFGIINGASSETPFSANQALAALSNYNSVMTDAVYESTITDGCYQFKLDNGKSCIMLWSDEPKNISLDLGVSSITLVDMYGNKQTVNSDCGEYTFAANTNISYIIGDFKSGTLVQNPTYVDIEGAVAKNTNNTFSKVTVSGSGTMNCDDIKIQTSENVLAYKERQSDGTFELRFLNISDSDGYAKITIIKLGSIIYSGRVLVQKQCGDKTLYDSRTDGYQMNYRHGIYNCEVDGKNAILVFDTKNKDVVHTISSKPFASTSDVIINADVKLMGNANAVLSATDGSINTELVRMNESGSFVCADMTENEIGYEINKWYNIECVYIQELKTFNIYVDGAYIGKANADFSSGIKGISAAASSQSDSDVYFDNLRVSEYDEFGMSLKSAVAAESDMSIEIEFSGSVRENADLSTLAIADENGDLVGISDIVRISATKLKAELIAPLEQNRLYTVFINGIIQGCGERVCKKDELNIISNATGYIPTVKSIFSEGEKFRTVNNSFSLKGNIIIALSRPIADDLDLNECISLTCVEEQVQVSISLSNDGKNIILKPILPLIEGESYELNIINLKAEQDIPFDDKKVVFTSNENYTKTADGISDNAQIFSVNGEYNTGRISIKGKTDVLNDTITIMAMKPDYTDYDRDSIVAIKEIHCNESGEYEFSFTVDKLAGEYKIFVNSLSEKNKMSKGFVFRNFLPELVVRKNGAAVKEMTELKVGDDIEVFAGGFNMTNSFKGYVMLAQYGNNVLKDVKCIDASRNSTYVGSEISFNEKVGEGVDEIKVMYFKADSNVPVCLSYDIK